MTSMKQWMIAAATTAALAGSMSARADDVAQDRMDCTRDDRGAVSAGTVDYSALYGDPTWPADAQRAGAISLQGPGETDSTLDQDPTWPQTAVVAPPIALDTYAATRPDGSIDNEGPWQPVRAYAHLDAQTPCVTIAHR